MCINMRRLTLATGLTVEVPCHLCWQCRADRVRNWTGKCIAESQTSAAVDFVTLTYCDSTSKAAKWIKDPVAPGYAKHLVYADVQKYLKRIRKAGHKVRYVCAGEYGDQKGRAHWHIILFWQDARPARRELYGNEWQDEFWHHGHVNYQPFCEAAAKYVCKYLLDWADEKDIHRKTIFRFSARPGIGFNWLCDKWIQMHLDQKLAPQSAKYRFPDVLDGQGKPREFRMSPHAQIKFVQEFERRWYAQYYCHPPPSSWCDKVLDKAARKIVLDALERRKYQRKPDVPTPNGEPVYFDEKLNAFYFDCGGFRALRYYWSYDDDGARAWSSSLVAPARAASLRAARVSTEVYRTASQARMTSSSSDMAARSASSDGLRSVANVDRCSMPLRSMNRHGLERAFSAISRT
ncbi:MAG: replication initiator protein [Microviridae sp.]|nr:MAG: replication initiator protein [Microviridae sp.]